jgi:glutamyl-tRNA synthetase
MTRSPYRGRFAPSPTGPLHLGLARTALLGWLRARSAGGAFILRIEDLDTARVVEGAAEALLEDLRWLGLDWDEGPDVGGPCGPYVQSQRRGLYAAAVQQLEADARVYPCSCTRKEIAIASAPHGPADYGAVYPGTCRAGPRRPHAAMALRFRMPDRAPRWRDAFEPAARPQLATGDFVIRRADGLHSYQLAVVVDDAAMRISEVLRGDDLRGCTPWQLALYDALGLVRPGFCHVPLVHGPDGARLAKRHAAVAVADYRGAGVAAESLVGWLAASCGLIEPGRPCAPGALIGRFDLARVAHGPTRLRSAELPQPS